MLFYFHSSVFTKILGIVSANQ